MDFHLRRFASSILIELEFSLVMALVVRMKKESRQLNLVEQRNAWNFGIFECSREKN